MCKEQYLGQIICDKAFTLSDPSVSKNESVWCSESVLEKNDHSGPSLTIGEDALKLSLTNKCNHRRGSSADSLATINYMTYHCIFVENNKDPGENYVAP